MAYTVSDAAYKAATSPSRASIDALRNNPLMLGLPAGNIMNVNHYTTPAGVAAGLPASGISGTDMATITAHNIAAGNLGAVPAGTIIEDQNGNVIGFEQDGVDYDLTGAEVTNWAGHGQPQQMTDHQIVVNDDPWPAGNPFDIQAAEDAAVDSFATGGTVVPSSYENPFDSVGPAWSDELNIFGTKPGQGVDPTAGNVYDVSPELYDGGDFSAGSFNQGGDINNPWFGVDSARTQLGATAGLSPGLEVSQQNPFDFTQDPTMYGGRPAGLDGMGTGAMANLAAGMDWEVDPNTGEWNPNAAAARHNSKTKNKFIDWYDDATNTGGSFLDKVMTPFEWLGDGANKLFTGIGNVIGNNAVGRGFDRFGNVWSDAGHSFSDLPGNLLNYTDELVKIPYGLGQMAMGNEYGWNNFKTGAWETLAQPFRGLDEIITLGGNLLGSLGINNVSMNSSGSLGGGGGGGGSRKSSQKRKTVNTKQPSTKSVGGKSSSSGSGGSGGSGSGSGSGGYSRGNPGGSSRPALSSGANAAAQKKYGKEHGIAALIDEVGGRENLAKGVWDYFDSEFSFIQPGGNVSLLQLPTGLDLGGALDLSSIIGGDKDKDKEEA